MRYDSRARRNSPWLTMRQVAMDLGVSKQRVHQLIREGKLEAVRAARFCRDAGFTGNPGGKLRRNSWLVSAQSVYAYQRRRDSGRSRART